MRVSVTTVVLALIAVLLLFMLFLAAASTGFFEGFFGPEVGSVTGVQTSTQRVPPPRGQQAPATTGARH